MTKPGYDAKQQAELDELIRTNAWTPAPLRVRLKRLALCAAPTMAVLGVLALLAPAPVRWFLLGGAALLVVMLLPCAFWPERMVRAAFWMSTVSDADLARQRNLHLIP